MWSFYSEVKLNSLLPMIVSSISFSMFTQPHIFLVLIVLVWFFFVLFGSLLVFVDTFFLLLSGTLWVLFLVLFVICWYFWVLWNFSAHQYVCVNSATFLQNVCECLYIYIYNLHAWTSTQDCTDKTRSRVRLMPLFYNPRLTTIHSWIYMQNVVQKEEQNVLRICENSDEFAFFF